MPRNSGVIAWSHKRPLPGGSKATRLFVDVRTSAARFGRDVLHKIRSYLRTIEAKKRAGSPTPLGQYLTCGSV